MFKNTRLSNIFLPSQLDIPILISIEWAIPYILRLNIISF